MIFQFIFFYFSGISLLSHHFCYGKVMMEYIGATGIPMTFKEVPVSEGIEFNFILGFAIDSDSEGNHQNGVFSPYWVSTLDPQSVIDIKVARPNVKVLASLSGWSIADKVLRWYDRINAHLENLLIEADKSTLEIFLEFTLLLEYDPIDQDHWISNAFSSLRSLAIEYSLDGFDIDYENFPKGNSTFAYCIGELLTLLKNQSVISLATIAPFYSTTKPYIELFQRYGDVIDYVNYQFYTDNVRFPSQYLNTFLVRSEQFDVEKLLPSYEVDGRGIQGDAFFAALDLIEKNAFDFKGIMIFSADASSSNNYHYERKSQSFLLNQTFT